MVNLRFNPVTQLNSLSNETCESNVICANNEICEM